MLAALAYNCGPGVVAKSSVLSKLKAGNRDIESAYIAHSRYKGKQLSQLKRRRQEELATLFIKDLSTIEPAAVQGDAKADGYQTHSGLNLPEETPDSLAPHAGTH